MRDQKRCSRVRTAREIELRLATQLHHAMSFEKITPSPDVPAPAIRSTFVSMHCQQTDDLRYPRRGACHRTLLDGHMAGDYRIPVSIFLSVHLGSRPAHSYPKKHQDFWGWCSRGFEWVHSMPWYDLRAGMGGFERAAIIINIASDRQMSFHGRSLDRTHGREEYCSGCSRVDHTSTTGRQFISTAVLCQNLYQIGVIGVIEQTNRKRSIRSSMTSDGRAEDHPNTRSFNTLDN